MPWRARGVRPLHLRRWAGRPQLKREPLGGSDHPTALVPTPEQLRHEAFADAVEQATRMPLWLRLIGSTGEPLRVRVRTTDGREVEFRLEEVDLDGRQLRGKDLHGAVTTVPLSSTEAVWQRQPRVWRSATVWVAGGLTGVLLGFGGHTLGMLFGALLGLLGGAFVSWLLNDSPIMYQWRELYGGPAA